MPGNTEASELCLVRVTSGEVEEDEERDDERDIEELGDTVDDGERGDIAGDIDVQGGRVGGLLEGDTFT